MQEEAGKTIREWRTACYSCQTIQAFTAHAAEPLNAIGEGAWKLKIEGAAEVRFEIGNIEEQILHSTPFLPLGCRKASTSTPRGHNA
jgi:hypothetical protein